MFKYRKPLWIGTLCLGGLGAATSLAFIIAAIVNGRPRVLPLIVLGFLLLGSLFLCLLARQSLKGLQQPAVAKNAAVPEALQQKTDRRFSRSVSIFVLLLAGVVFLGLYAKAQATPSIPQSDEVTGVFYERAEVLSIVEEEYRGDQDMEDVPIGHQLVNVEVKTGKFKGRQFEVENYLSYFYGTVLKPGDPVTISFSLTDGNIEAIYIQDYDRSWPLIIVVLLFLIITMLVGGKVGAKSLVGLGFTILCIFSILIPLLIGGAPTLPTIWLMCAYVTIVTFVILDGVNRKTICAIFGTILGVAFAAAFGKFFCWIMRITGFQMRDVDSTIEALVQIRQGQIMDGVAPMYIKDLLVGGILIAALGAVNDVAMSISSAMNELIRVNPNLTRKELFKSGMNIGRDMVGTMTNTLILALVGGSLISMIYLSSLEPTFRHFMSTAYLSVEVVQAVASSLGVILGVPSSVVLGVLLFGKIGKKKTKQK